MSLFKRKIGRRAAGVAVGVTLRVLGLEAPAFAAPTVSGVSPTSGPADCVAVITGTGFMDFPQADQDLTFVGPVAGPGDDLPVAAADWFAVSDTEIWALVPAVAPGTSYSVSVTDPTGGVPAGTFLATSGAGGCAPTIASFTPTCGAAGTTVVITGTNLLEPDLTGGTVAFNPYTGLAADAVHTVPDVDSPTSLSVIVPANAADGKIRVTTFGATTGGQGFSATNFQVPPEDCKAGGNVHARSVSLSLRKHLVARGRVSSTEDPAFTDCVAGVPVKIQRRRAGGWRTVGSTTTSDTGAYKKRIKDRPGKYRALAPKVTLGDPVTDTCSRAVSPRRTHRH